MITFEMDLLSAKFSETGERVAIDWNVGALRKYESCRVRTGEFDRTGLPSLVKMDCAKSSREVCSEQSITAWDSPKTFAATCKLLAMNEAAEEEGAPAPILELSHR